MLAAAAWCKDLVLVIATLKTMLVQADVCCGNMKKMLCPSSFNRGAIVVLIWVALSHAFLPFLT